MNYYEHHLGDYLRDTAHLSMLEDAAYRRLLDAYYIREKALPLDVRECCKLVRATSKQERDAVAYVLREFFRETEDGYRQKRADAEIARFQEKQAKAKRSAEARWSAKRSESEGNANASADAMRTHSEGNAPRARPQTPDTRHQTQNHSGPDGPGVPPPKPAAVKAVVDPVKDELWRLGRAVLEGQGMTRDAAGTFLGKLVKDHGQKRVLDVVREAVRDPKADPKSWLVAACQQRETEGKQSALERRNASVAENWLPPEVRDATV